MPQPALQLRAVSAAEREFGPILENDSVIAMSPWLELVYPVGVDDGGAMDTYEILGIKSLQELPYCGPVQVGFWPDM